MRAKQERSAAIAIASICENLKKALEEKAWDGDWYRRAYFDDGTPLGSSQNEECRIDSIAQSWAVISGAAESIERRRAMAAVEEYLIRRGDGLVILFTPPFDKGKLDPGYIKGYVPGVRENGGQYTHAAHLDLDCLRDARRRRTSRRTVLAAESDQSLVDARRAAQVQSRTLRRCRRRLRRAAAHGPRGLDLVHGFGGLDVSRRPRIDSGLSSYAASACEIDPCIPRGWREFEITYKHGRRGATRYHIKVENPHGVCRGIAKLEIDGKVQQSSEIVLADDAQSHDVRVILGEQDTA